MVLCDAITSGGLLVAIDPQDAENYVKALKEAGQDSWIIGKVIEKQEKLIYVNRTK